MLLKDGVFFLKSQIVYFLVIALCDHFMSFVTLYIHMKLLVLTIFNLRLSM